HHTPPSSHHTLSLHDALPIFLPTTLTSIPPSSTSSPRTSPPTRAPTATSPPPTRTPAAPTSPSAPPTSTSTGSGWRRGGGRRPRSEEHTSELQSQSNLVCRLL